MLLLFRFASSYRRPPKAAAASRSSMIAMVPHGGIRP
jgi:hypothetical protein